MARRHHLSPGDWASVARRLEELVAAGTGEAPLDVVLELLFAKLQAERSGQAFSSSTVLRRLAEGRAQWPGVFEDPCLPRIPAGVRAAAVEALAPLTVEGAHETALDAIFEGLTSRRRRSDKGQFFTPRTVCVALAQLVPLPDSGRILDPACGSGGLLAAALSRRPGLQAVGMDADAGALRVARLLALLSRQPTHWQHADALREEPTPTGPWDVILSNPPFAGDLQDAALVQRFETARLVRPERDVLFVERCLDLLRPGGHLGLVVPAGRLAAKRHGTWRDWLLRRLRVSAVVSLPEETFQPHTAQRTALLVGTKRPKALGQQAPLPCEPIAFAVSERAGRDRRGRPQVRDGVAPDAPAWRALDHDLDEVVRQVQEVCSG